MCLQRKVFLFTLTVWVTSSSADYYHPENEYQNMGMERTNIDPAELTAEHWIEEAQAAIRARLTHLRNDNDKIARNVVMFLGDGMSVPTMAAARTLLGQRTGHPGEEKKLAFEKFPSVGLSKVILGGGRREFIPTTSTDEEGTAGRRTDGRNLIEEWQLDKISRNVTHQYVWNRSQLLSAAENVPEYLMGLFEATHMQYNSEANKETEPTLSELTEIAIHSLSRNKKGFFLFVEGGRIDHAHHANRVELALDETIEFSNAVARATELLSAEDSLIVVTADHAHVMTFNGYTQRGSDILGISNDRDQHGTPYMTLSYSNGPGFRPHINGVRPNVTEESNFGALRWRSHVDVPLSSETHGGDDVAVFAYGPHHAMFTGLYEQSQLPHLMAYAACIGPGLQACSSAPRIMLMPSLLFLIGLYSMLLH
ncbi:unnamed protein product, partial [Iphiclides podalirius]